MFDVLKRLLRGHSYLLYSFLLLAIAIPFIQLTPIPTTASDNMSVSTLSRTVVKKVLAVETPEGVGALVRRSIGSMTLRNLTPFLLLDHFHVREGAGFPDHPHRGQATVTYMLEGSSRHEDSAGHKGTILPGGVQWMSAGKGIIHAEMPIHEKGSPDPRGLQLWIDLPKTSKMTVCRTYCLTRVVSYENVFILGIRNRVIKSFLQKNGVDGPVKIKVISGKSHGVESPVRPLGGCWYFHITFNQAGTMFQELPRGWTSFLYSWKGTLKVGSDSDANAVPTFHTAVLSADSEQTGVALSGEENTELVLISGEPLDQTVFQYGPFVMTSKEEIQQTLFDYQTGRNGFEKAHSWKSEIAHETK